MASLWKTTLPYVGSVKIFTVWREAFACYCSKKKYKSGWRCFIHYAHLLWNGAATDSRLLTSRAAAHLKQTVNGRGYALRQQTHPLLEQRLVAELAKALRKEAKTGENTWMISSVCVSQSSAASPGQRGVLHPFQLLHTITIITPTLPEHWSSRSLIGDLSSRKTDHTFHPALFFYVTALSSYPCCACSQLYSLSLHCLIILLFSYHLWRTLNCTNLHVRWYTKFVGCTYFK